MRNMAMVDDIEPLLTANQVADLLAISRKRAYELASQGRLPAVRLGRQVRFRRRDVRALIEGGGAPEDVATDDNVVTLGSRS